MVIPPQTPVPTPTPPQIPQGCPSGYLPNGQGYCCDPFTGVCLNEGGVTPSQNCPSGYLPNGQGSCCNPSTGHCINGGSTQDGTPPNTQQIYSGEWKCTAGLVPTSGGNCLDPNTGNVYFPVFVINFSSSGGCEAGKREIIDEDGTKVCVGGTFLDLGVVVRPNKPNPINPNHPASVSPRPYIPIAFVRSGGRGGGGSGNTGRGTNNLSEIKTNLLTVPCLITSVGSVVYQIEHPSRIDFINKLNDAFGFRGDFQVTFRESNSVVDQNGNQVAAQTGLIDRNTNNIEITLNTTMLPGTSNIENDRTI